MNVNHRVMSLHTPLQRGRKQHVLFISYTSSLINPIFKQYFLNSSVTLFLRIFNTSKLTMCGVYFSVGSQRIVWLDADKS
jgi:hypothetical protein